MPTLLLIGISNITGIQILVPTGRELVVLYSEVAGAVTDIVINAILIPKMASSGAAIGTLISEAVVLAVQLCFLKGEVSGAFKSIQYIKIIIAAALGTVASLWVVRLGLGNFVTLLISAVLFFGVYGCVLLVTKERFVAEIAEQTVGKLFRSINRRR
jgi:O-antigen/teichoic acid export membrane protein